mgnify:FL=1
MVEFIESKLVRLRKEVDEMWDLVRTQIEKSGNAVQSLNREDAQTVIVRERHVNAFELKIDSDIEDIIALYSPVAVDLRLVLAMLKINSNLERIGDFAEGIARFVIHCPEPLNETLMERLQLKTMFTTVLDMLDMAKRALDEESPDLATSVLAKDNLLDDINSAVTPILADYLGEHPDDRLACLNLVSVFRKLERAGDHITNMAEEIIFFVNAKVLKHQGNTDEHYV